MYPDDFDTSEAAFAPVSDGLFIGVSPLILFLCLLLLATVAALGWWLGSRSGSNRRGDDAVPADIHKAILAASSAAMAASSNDLKARAQALRDKIVERLGPVLDMAKGVSPPLKALDEALKGEKKVEAKPAAPATPPVAPASAHSGCSCGKPEACSCGKGPTGPVTVNQVYIGGLPVGGSDCGCKGPHKPDCGHAGTPPPAPAAKSETVAMTGPEQIEALARAVRQFHDHWLDGPARIRELKAARDALSRKP